MEIKPVNPKGNQPWTFIGRTDAEAETPVFWPPDAKSQLIGKGLDAWKDKSQEKKGITEDEMVERHHQLDGHEFEQALGVGDGQGSLLCCSPWGHNESDVIEPLNWTELFFYFSPTYLPWSDGSGCHDLSFLNAEFKPAFSLSTFTFTKSL